MRRIGILLVLLFALRLRFAEGRLDVRLGDQGTIGWQRIWASAPGEDGAVYASGLELPWRASPRPNPLHDLWRLLMGSKEGRKPQSSKRKRRTRRRQKLQELPAPTELSKPLVAVSSQNEASKTHKKRGRTARIDTRQVCCIHVDCRGYRKYGEHPDHRIIAAGKYGTKNNGHRQMYRCQWCHRRFSETQGTVFYDLKTPMETVCRALIALSEGTGIRSVARTFGEKPETILLWLRRAGEHCQQVSDYLMHNLHMTQAQMDELWTFVRKKEKNLTAWERLHTEYGDTWVWVVFDPVSKLVLALVVGEREEQQAVNVLQQLKNRLLANHLPLFTSDQLPHYLKALLKVFGRWVQPQRQGDCGRFPNPRLEAPADLLYATVNKQKQNGRVVSVTTQTVLGNPTAIARQLEATRSGLKINTSFVERMNLTLRHLVSRLRRKGLTFSKKRKYLVWHLQLAVSYYHFVRPHGSLRQRLPEPLPTRGSPKLWAARTPAMAANMTDHPWTIKELLSFRVPPVSAA